MLFSFCVACFRRVSRSEITKVRRRLPDRCGCAGGESGSQGDATDGSHVGSPLNPLHDISDPTGKIIVGLSFKVVLLVYNFIVSPLAEPVKTLLGIRVRLWDWLSADGTAGTAK